MLCCCPRSKIGDDGVDAAIWKLFQPLKAVARQQPRAPVVKFLIAHASPRQ